MNAIANADLLPAWADPVHDAQAAFRCVLKALSEPGLPQTLPVTVTAPARLDAATVALCLALFDLETPVWVDDSAYSPAVAEYLRFHCGCPIADAPVAAAFAVLANTNTLQLDRFAQGTMEYPDRSATLLIQVPSLVDGPERILSGPGIARTRIARIGGLPEDFNARWRDNTAQFPLGVDLVFCCGNEVVGLPRTTRIVE